MQLDPPFERLICSWKDAFATWSHLRGAWAFAFRGEHQLYSSALPKVDRLVNLSRWHSLRQRLLIERHLTQRFCQDAALYLGPVEANHLSSFVPTWVVMQHYGAPTRLFDWTLSFWVALFFACTNGPNSDGQVRFFNRYVLELAVTQRFGTQTNQVFNSRTVTFPPSPEKFDLLDPSKSSCLDDWVVPLYFTGARFPRLTAQQGCFTVASKPNVDHWRAINDLIAHSDEPRGFGVIKVDGGCKREILIELRQMGLSAASMFPGLEGVCMDLVAEAASPDLTRDLERVIGLLEQ